MRKALAVKMLVYSTFVINLIAVLFLVGYSFRHPVTGNTKAADYQDQAVAKSADSPEPNAEQNRQIAGCGDSYACKLTEPMTILTTFLVLGVFATNWIYYKQLIKMREAVALTGKQAVTAQGQLTAMQGGLNQTSSIIEKMEGQLIEMERQGKRFDDSLAMERAKTDPRIRIADVRSINLDIDKSPIFRVAIVNDGLLPADVAFLLGVKIDKREFWNNMRTITVAAGEREYQFVEARFVLQQSHIDVFNKAGAAPSLMVVGHFSYWPHVPDPSAPMEFCFKYLPWPWHRERPEGIPEFIPCEHETGLNITLHVESAIMTMTGGEVTLEVGKPTEAEEKPKTKQEDEDEGQKPN